LCTQATDPPSTNPGKRCDLFQNLGAPTPSPWTVAAAQTAAEAEETSELAEAGLLNWRKLEASEPAEAEEASELALAGLREADATIVNL
jgi:hypothetical protein